MEWHSLIQRARLLEDVIGPALDITSVVFIM